jgi:hypothetical protein
MQEMPRAMLMAHERHMQVRRETERIWRTWTKMEDVDEAHEIRRRDNHSNNESLACQREAVFLR